MRLSQEEPWKTQFEVMGEFIRTQRKLAQLSLRELAERTNISNPYLSQVERGLHEPSVRVIRSIAKALNLSAETLLSQAGLLEAEQDTETSYVEEAAKTTTLEAIQADPDLTPAQKQALSALYTSFLKEAKS